MVKNDSKRYIVDGQRLSLKALYEAAPRVEGKNRNILRLIRTELAPGIPVTVLFVRHPMCFRATFCPPGSIGRAPINGLLADCFICSVMKSVRSIGWLL